MILCLSFVSKCVLICDSIDTGDYGWFQFTPLNVKMAFLLDYCMIWLQNKLFLEKKQIICSQSINTVKPGDFVFLLNPVEEFCDI